MISGLRLVALLCLTLSACAAPPPAAVSRGAADVTVTDVTKQALPALNRLRTAAGTAPVRASEKLAAAAKAHAGDMAARGYFAHKGPNGSTLIRRMARQGYGYCFAAENIAKGQTSLEAVMRSWQGSPGHRRNMLNAEAREFGLARAGTVWVMVLGRPGC